MMTGDYVRLTGLLLALLQIGNVAGPILVTRNGHATGGVALTRDGKVLAYAMQERDGPSSLWLRDVAAGKDTRLPPLGTYGRSIAFSPDGKSLYFLKDRPNRPGTTDLMERALEAATPAAKLRVEDVDSPVTFSPDGKSFAFVRNVPGKGAYLIAVPLAAPKERELKFWPAQESSVVSPAWSPDGTEIAVGQRIRDAGKILFIPTGKGTAHEIKTPDRVFGLAWVKAGLFVLMPLPRAGGICQIWRVNPADSKWTQVTNDEAGFENTRLTVSDDGSLLAAARYRIIKTGMDDLLKWVKGESAAVRDNPDVVLLRPSP